MNQAFDQTYLRNLFFLLIWMLEKKNRIFIAFVIHRFNSLISLFKDEDYIYLKREDLEELKNSLPISNLLSIINYSIAHNRTNLTSIFFIS